MSAAFQVLWQVLTPIFLLAGAGYLLARRLNVRSVGLGKAAFYVFTPCLLFDKFSHSNLSANDLGRLALFAVLTIASSGLVAWTLGKLLHFDRVTGAAFVLCAIAGNTGNYGLPTNQFAFGDAALEPAVIYYAMSTLILSTVGIYVASSGRQTAGQALRNVFSVPLAYAGVAGLLVWATGLTVPLPIERFAGLAGQAAIPVMLVILGMQLAGVRLRENIGQVSVAAATKLLSGPLLGLFFASLLGLSGVTRQAAVVEASVPTAVLAMVLAAEYDTAPRFTASVVMVSTLASLVTMTLVLVYLR
ncbi:MAG: AEC family transporter [Anaerolineae bacterium]